MFTLGKRIIKNEVEIKSNMLTDSVAGGEYTLKIQTKGVSNPEETLKLLRDKLNEKFGITVLYGEVADNVITLQIKSHISLQFAWSAILVFLPQILIVVGVVVAMIAVYLMISSIPSWVYAMGVMAIVLLFISPIIVKPTTKRLFKRLFISPIIVKPTTKR